MAQRKTSVLSKQSTIITQSDLADLSESLQEVSPAAAAMVLEFSGHKMRKLRESDPDAYAYWAKDAFSVAAEPMAMVALHKTDKQDMDVLFTNDEYDKTFSLADAKPVPADEQWPPEFAKEVRKLMASDTAGNQFTSPVAASEKLYDVYLYKFRDLPNLDVNFAVLFFNASGKNTSLMEKYIPLLIRECGGFPTLISIVDGYEYVSEKLAIFQEKEVKNLEAWRHVEGVTKERSDPMREESKLDNAALAPIFEGELDRESMAEALDAAMRDQGLSVRKAGEASGTSAGIISSIKDQRASLDKAVEVLDQLGFETGFYVRPKDAS